MTIFDDELDAPDERAIATYRAPMPDGKGGTIEGLWLIDMNKLDQLTELLQLMIANTVADIIGAGSERDAVMENETLYSAIFDELKGWSNHPDNAPHEPKGG